MKFKINYEFDKIKTNLNGGTSSTSSSSTSSTNNFQGLFNRVTNANDFTASYIYAKDPKGVFYFALARKVPLGARIRITSGLNTGAAGTDIECMGKWGNFGGKIGKKSVNNYSYLRAAVNEINDEGDLNIHSINNVSINGINNKLLILRYFKNVNNLNIFLFEMRPNDFFNYFPRYFSETEPKKRGGAFIVERSKGEIDYVTSMSMQEIINKQNETINIYKNDFLLPYCIDTFNTEIIPAIDLISTAFSNKNYKTKLIKHSNVIEANQPLLDPHNKKYQETGTGTYIEIQ